MEIAGKLVENTEHRKQETLPTDTPDQSAYFKMAALDRELHNWMARLPADLKNNEENRRNAPYSFYLLHQQYHAVLILLHRPFARYDDPNKPETEEISALDSHFSKASRGICTKSAVAMARIFWQHRQRFDGKVIFCIGMQHAGLAATALIAALAYISNEADRTNNLEYLEVLHAALQDMSHAYQPAERMAKVLDAVMIELRGGAIGPAKVLSSASSTIPARRGSSALETAVRPAMKRRTTSKTRAPKQRVASAKTLRTHQASDASDARSVAQQQEVPRDFLFETSSWAMVSGPGPEQFDDSGLPLGMEHSMAAPLDDRQDWMDFPAIPSLSSLPGISDGDTLDFLALPSEDDWSRWHSGGGDIATDLDGFPPRGRFTTFDFDSPGMGGIING